MNPGLDLFFMTGFPNLAQTHLYLVGTIIYEPELLMPFSAVMEHNYMSAQD